MGVVFLNGCDPPFCPPFSNLGSDHADPYCWECPLIYSLSDELSGDMCTEMVVVAHNATPVMCVRMMWSVSGCFNSIGVSVLVA
jgi:hypothetical protein